MSCSKWAYEPEKCDGDYCVGDCRLTSDIRHAENFIKYNNVFCEKEAAGELIKERGGESRETD